MRHSVILFNLDTLRKEEKAYHLCVWMGLKDGDFTHGEFLRLKNQRMYVSSHMYGVLLYAVLCLPGKKRYI